MGKPKRCFVISPIGKKNSPTREHADKFLKDIVEPVVRELGYTRPKRADKISEPGIITAQIIERVVEDDLVVADLTDGNPNVYYELAVRHVARKPLILMIKIGTLIPFDVSASRVIQFDLTNSKNLVACRKELKAQIAELHKKPENLDNPITAGLDLSSLRKNENALGQQVANLMIDIERIDGCIDDVLGNLDTFNEKLNESISGLEIKMDSIENIIGNLESILTNNDFENQVSEIAEGNKNEIENIIEEKINSMLEILLDRLQNMSIVSKVHKV